MAKLQQVRYMMAVLYMVGDGLEEPLQAKRLLDLELFPKKPHFAKVP
jgi:tRNA U38,U39,U40 pseudouridine synthase TruA